MKTFLTASALLALVSVLAFAEETGADKWCRETVALADAVAQEREHSVRLGNVARIFGDDIPIAGKPVAAPPSGENAPYGDKGLETGAWVALGNIEPLARVIGEEIAAFGDGGGSPQLPPALNSANRAYLQRDPEGFVAEALEKARQLSSAMGLNQLRGMRGRLTRDALETMTAARERVMLTGLAIEHAHVMAEAKIRLEQAGASLNGEHRRAGRLSAETLAPAISRLDCGMRALDVSIGDAVPR